MLTVVFIITTVICAGGWFFWYVNAAAVVHYIGKKGYVAPSDSEWKECVRWVLERIFRFDH